MTSGAQSSLGKNLSGPWHPSGGPLLLKLFTNSLGMHADGQVKHEPNATVQNKFFFPCSPATLAVAQANRHKQDARDSQQRCFCWPWNAAANASICSASMSVSPCFCATVAALPHGQARATYDGRSPHVRGSRSQTISICSH